MLVNTDNKITFGSASGEYTIGHNSIGANNCAGGGIWPYAWWSSYLPSYPTFPVYAVCEHCRKQEQLAYALATLPVGWLKLDATSEPTRVFCSKKCVSDAMK